jgi:hypothetical protein
LILEAEEDLHTIFARRRDDIYLNIVNITGRQVGTIEVHSPSSRTALFEVLMDDHGAEERPLGPVSVIANDALTAHALEGCAG